MQRLAAINGLRGYAILGVIYFHLLGVFFNLPGWNIVPIGGLPIMPLTYLSNGWVGVNLFFMLSGFVLYLPYQNGNRKFETKIDIVNFFKNRAARLFPLYYISLLISIIFILHQNNIYNWAFWKNILVMSTFTFNFSKETFIPANNYVLWSLGIEVLFSLVFPLLVLGIKQKGIVFFSIVVFIFSFSVRIISFLNPEYEVAPHLSLIKDSLFGRLDDFVCGMLLCHLFYANWKINWLTKNNEFVFILSLLVIALGCHISDYVYLKFVPTYLEPFINTFFQLGFGMIILSLLHTKNSFLNFIFCNKFLQLCGMMCYSLYLWHGNIRWFFIADYSYLRIATYLFLLFSLSFLTYRYIEFGNKKIKDILP